jgi:hypothetical protein
VATASSTARLTPCVAWVICGRLRRRSGSARDPVDLEQVQEFGDQHGIYHDDLISWGGGSP